MNCRFLTAAAVVMVAEVFAETVVPRFRAEHVSWQNRTVVTPEDGGFMIRRKNPDEKNATAWQVESAAIAVPAGRRAWSLSFEIRDTGKNWLLPNAINGWQSYNDGWKSILVWFAADGKLLGESDVMPEFRKGDRFSRFVFRGEIPSRAVTAKVRIGIDDPRIDGEDSVTVRNAALGFHRDLASAPAEVRPDVLMPEVRLVSESPTEDASAPVRFRITDAGGVDWASVKLFSKAGSSLPFTREGDVISARVALETGINSFRVEAADMNGNRLSTKRLVVIGRKPAVPAVTLREDGMTLVDGRPFFPIGMYGVDPREANGGSIDRAFEDLKAGGFNFGMSYTRFSKPEYTAAAARHGFRLWMPVPGVEDGAKWICREAENPVHLAWYTADDTAHYHTPEKVLEYEECAKAMDGMRPTCQADPVESWRPGLSCYARYVNYTDVFMPEIYPSGHPHYKSADTAPVAVTIADMERAKADIRRYGDGRPRGLWPILPIFKGWGWTRFSTPEELEACVFAAIVHGAHGLTYYTYGGYQNPEKNVYNYGCTSSPEVWAMTTNVTRKVAALAPVLVEPTPPQPPVPEVLEGPKTDALGQPSVTMLLKRHQGWTYVIAVNSADAPVKAKLRLPGKEIVDDFPVFGVRFHRYPDIPVATAAKAKPVFSPRIVHDGGRTVKIDGVGLARSVRLMIAADTHLALRLGRAWKGQA